MGGGAWGLCVFAKERNVLCRWAENCWARLMDWKLCLWQSLDQYEAARSPSKQVNGLINPLQAML